MSDYLANLVARTVRPAAIQPRARSSFEAYAQPDRIAGQAADYVENSGSGQLHPDRASTTTPFPQGDRESVASSALTLRERDSVAEKPSPAESVDFGMAAIEQRRPAGSRTESPLARMVAPSPPPLEPPPPEAITPRPEKPTSAKTSQQARTQATPPEVDPSIRPPTFVSAQAKGPMIEAITEQQRWPRDAENAARRRPSGQPVDSEAVSLHQPVKPIAKVAPVVAEAAQARYPTVESLKSEDSVFAPVQPVDVARLESRTAAPRAEKIAEEAPTIRVTIGRLEVRAPSPPPRFSRKVAELRRPTLSLDEYLRHRDSGQR